MSAHVADPAPTLEDLEQLAALAADWGELADSIRQSIKLRPMAGEPRSSYALDFAEETLNERSLLAFGLPGALGLLQGIRGNARALTAIYKTYGPPAIGPAPFYLMRGIWEHSVLLMWLLDGSISSPQRVGRFKAWLTQGLTRAANTFGPEIEEAIQESLNEWGSPALKIPGFATLSRLYRTEGAEVYRGLSGIVHGRSWTVLGTMENLWAGEGFKTRWRGYPLPLHGDYSEITSQSGRDAMQIAEEYFQDKSA